MKTEPILHHIQREWHGTLAHYIIGFIFSLLLTSLSFFIVVQRPFSENMLIYTVMGLALLQAIIQLLFFLHIGKEKRPRLELISLLFTTLILLIVVIGSIWVMNDLNMRMMPDMNMNMTEGMSHD